MADTLIRGTTIIEDKRTEKGEVWSCAGNNFKGTSPEVDNIAYINLDTGKVLGQENDNTLIAPVSLPNGATITAAIVYGNAAAASGITWTLYRVNISSDSGGSLASASVNTEDTSISDAVIDNNTFAYFISTGTDEFDNNDEIHGARIKYEF